MSVDHSRHKFFKDLGTDWVAVAANGMPLARAATEAAVRRAAPDAAYYATGVKSSGEDTAERLKAVANTQEPVVLTRTDLTPAVEQPEQKAPPKPRASRKRKPKA